MTGKRAPMDSKSAAALIKKSTKENKPTSENEVERLALEIQKTLEQLGELVAEQTELTMEIVGKRTTERLQ